MCYEPVREFTPRARLHDPGTIAGPLVHTGGHAPHWSRWEKSATTFGPAGRVVASVLLFATLPAAWSFGMVLYVVLFPVVAVTVLASIWAKGWVVPDEPHLPPLPDPPRMDATPAPPLTTAQWAWKIGWWSLVVAASAAFAYGPIPVKAGVLAMGTLVGLYAFWRGFLSR
jgi:hypothetical protein